MILKCILIFAVALIGLAAFFIVTFRFHLDALLCITLNKIKLNAKLRIGQNGIVIFKINRSWSFLFKDTGELDVETIVTYLKSAFVGIKEVTVSGKYSIKRILDLKMTEVKQIDWNTSIGIGSASLTSILSGAIYLLCALVNSLIMSKVGVCSDVTVNVTPLYNMNGLSSTFHCIVKLPKGKSIIKALLNKE